MLRMIGATAGGWLGWWLGVRAGLLAASFLSLIGTALGVYWASRFVRSHL